MHVHTCLLQKGTYRVIHLIRSIGFFFQQSRTVSSHHDTISRTLRRFFFSFRLLISRHLVLGLYI